MKILYFTDNYTYSNMGTKRSIYEELIVRGHEVIWINKHKLSKLLEITKKYAPDQIWLAHSNLCLSKEVKQQIHIPVVGFGFSDPYYFSPKRFIGYDIYVTNHEETFKKYQNVIPMIYNPSACDFRFHRKEISTKKVIDISIIGLGKHMRFKNTLERINIVNKLRTFLNKKYNIHTYGQGWPQHINNYPTVSGEKFRNVIQCSELGLDIQDSYSPLAHRMFEYAGCGVPVITRRRSEVFKFFKENTEILSYSTHEELLYKVSYYLQHIQELRKIGNKAYDRCLKEHNISYRVNHLLHEIKKYKYIKKDT